MYVLYSVVYMIDIILNNWKHQYRPGHNDMHETYMQIGMG